MNRGELRTEVENLIQDTSFSEAELNSYINTALQYIAGQIYLPSLKGVDTVNTVLDTAYAALNSLTGGFSGILRRVVNSSGTVLTVYANLEMLMDGYPTLAEVGSVEAVALEGNTLWYQKIPETAETLTVLYYRSISTLDADGDSPSDIPEYLHRMLLVNGSAYFAYDSIEDGIDAEKVNTKSNFYRAFDESNQESGITKLREWVSKRRVNHISTFWSE